ncbi:MAG: hypothetical protein ACYDBP_15260 [Leptospirales bacterium]
MFHPAVGGFRRRGEDLDRQVRDSLEYAFCSPIIVMYSFETKSRSGSAPGAAFGGDRVAGGGEDFTDGVGAKEGSINNKEIARNILRLPRD